MFIRLHTCPKPWDVLQLNILWWAPSIALCRSLGDRRVLSPRPADAGVRRSVSIRWMHFTIIQYNGKCIPAVRRLTVWCAQVLSEPVTWLVNWALWSHSRICCTSSTHHLLYATKVWAWVRYYWNTSVISSSKGVLSSLANSYLHRCSCLDIVSWCLCIDPTTLIYLPNVEQPADTISKKADLFVATFAKYSVFLWKPRGLTLSIHPCSWTTVVPKVRRFPDFLLVYLTASLPMKQSGSWGICCVFFFSDKTHPNVWRLILWYTWVGSICMLFC